MSEVRVRFAPSPTGDLHVGGVRAALFNYLYAKHNNGKFVLRIEDTDAERSTEESINIIFEGLKWLGIDWDEEPIYQSQRGDLYTKAIEQLAEAGLAYRCFCTKERLDELREKAKAEKKLFIYDKKCANIPPEEAKARAEAGEPFVWRFRLPEEGAVEWEDGIRGTVTFEYNQIGDFVIARTDGSPIFYLANAVDDDDSGITDVIRGEDHLTNTAKQIEILKALNKPVPRYAHLPLVFGPDGRKLGKRHGAASILEFRDLGYLPETMLNFLVLIGWSLDDKTTILSHDELVEHFTIERVNKSKGIFDHKKLEWMNGQYIKNLSKEEFAKRAIDFIQANGEDISSIDSSWLTEVIALFQERVNTLAEIKGKIYYFLTDDIEFEEKAVKKFLQKEGATEALQACKQIIESIDPWTKESIEQAFQKYLDETESKFGVLANPLRVALTGSSASPSIIEVILLLGKEKCIQRISAKI